MRRWKALYLNYITKKVMNYWSEWKVDPSIITCLGVNIITFNNVSFPMFSAGLC